MASWQSISNIPPKRYICGFCGDDISSEKGYFSSNNSWKIYMCHGCAKPTFFDHELNQTPGARIGKKISNLPKDIEEIYKQVKDTTSVRAYSATILLARKLLMHVAVECGAKKDLNFQQYVDYLVDNNYTPPNSKSWVDKIRKMGNAANHEIVINSQEDSEQIIKFLEMLLLFKYEFNKEELEE